jgi:hypothetical protein
MVSPGQKNAQVKHVAARIRGGMLELSLLLDKPASIRVLLFDIRGKTVASWNISDLKGGHATQSFALPSLSAGMYFLGFQAEERVPTCLGPGIRVGVLLQVCLIRVPIKAQ